MPATTRRIRSQADRPVAAVELDLDGRPEGVVVLDVVALARPLGHRLSQLGPRRVGVVRREPHDRHEVGAEVHRRVEVAALVRLGAAGSASGGRARRPRPGGSGPTGRRRWRC